MHVELRLELCCVTPISAEYLSHVQLLEGKQLILLAAPPGLPRVLVLFRAPGAWADVCYQ